MELSITETANILGMNKSTVSRALKDLDATGWIDLNLIHVSVKLKRSEFSEDNEFPVRNKVLSTRNKCFL